MNILDLLLIICGIAMVIVLSVFLVITFKNKAPEIKERMSRILLIPTIALGVILIVKQFLN